MPRKVKELKALDVKRKSKAPGFHAVGGVAGVNLLIRVTTVGGVNASWILRTMVGGRRRNFGLGGYPDVTLEQARNQAREIKEVIKQGNDPITQKQAARDELRA